MENFLFTIFLFSKIFIALMFIVFEGIDGSGKTTISRKIGRKLREEGYEVFITEEPTETWVGRDVRRAIEEEKNPMTQALLFFADRAEHIEEIKKNMKKIVLCDRYVYSTYAYQGAQLSKIMDIKEALAWLEKIYEPMKIVPDMIFLIDVEPETGIGRIYGREKKEKFERIGFLKKVREIYLNLGNRYGFIIIDGNREIEDVVNEILIRIEEKLKYSLL